MLSGGPGDSGGDGLVEKVTLGSLVGAGEHEKVVGVAIDRMCVRGGGLGGGREGLAEEVYQRLIRRIMAEGGEGIEQALVGEHDLPQDQAKRAAGVFAARSGDIRCILLLSPKLPSAAFKAGVVIVPASTSSHLLPLPPQSETDTCPAILQKRPVRRRGQNFGDPSQGRGLAGQGCDGQQPSVIPPPATRRACSVRRGRRRL